MDDNEAIHNDFVKILGRSAENTAADDALLDSLETELFGDDAADAETVPLPALEFELVHALQGQEACEIAGRALAGGHRFAMAFVDMRMPPGWDGLRTIAELWRIDGDIEIVICSAYSDSTWDDMLAQFGRTDRLLILKKPFDVIEVQQLATALCEKWQLRQDARRTVEQLEKAVRGRTADLETALATLKTEMNERARREAELRANQKLEAVGRMAGNVAHEINTPLQYIGDALCFGREAANDLLEVAKRRHALRSGSASEAEHDECRELENELDLEFLHGELPASFERAIDGINKVGAIVRAMLGLTSDDDNRPCPVDLNNLVRDSLMMTNAEVRHAAEVKLELAELPMIECRRGELGHVLVALLSNARDAIVDRWKGRPGGTITIRSQHVNDNAVLEVEDNGCGIEDAIRHRVFEPFFTTKEVGRGTGQALSVAYSIAERHRGDLSFVSAAGRGTTFTLRLPISA